MALTPDTHSYLGNSKQVLVGAAAFFVSDTGADLPATLVPTDTATTSAKDVLAADAAWAGVGYTENGVNVSYQPTYGDVTVDQLLDSAVIFKSAMKVIVATTFAEATLENLIIVWGQNTGTLTNGVLTIEGGSLGDFPHERSLAFVGPAPRNSNVATERVYHINRAIQDQTSAHDLKRDAATTFPVSFRCLPGDSTGSGTAYGTVRDRALGS